jgi:hypothetical protein
MVMIAFATAGNLSGSAMDGAAGQCSRNGGRGFERFDQFDHEAVAWGDLAFGQQYLAHWVNS